MRARALAYVECSVGPSRDLDRIQSVLLCQRKQRIEMGRLARLLGLQPFPCYAGKPPAKPLDRGRRWYGPARQAGGANLEPRRDSRLFSDDKFIAGTDAERAQAEFERLERFIRVMTV